MKKTDRPAETTVKPTEPGHEQWAKLYAAAAEIRQLAPWNFLWGEDLITIMLPGREEPVYCSVMGRGGECYAIGVYPGYKAVATYFRLRTVPPGEPNYAAGLEQAFLACNFGDREEVTPQDREVYKALGLKFRGRNEWIYFRTLDPGLYPWYIDAEQAELLIQALQNLVIACKYLLTQEVSVDFDAGQTLLRYYSPEQKMWLNTVAELQPVPVEISYSLVENELLIARLKKQPRNTMHLEFDAVFLPRPLRENKEERPYFPKLLMLAEKKSTVVLDQTMLQPMDNIGGAAIGIICKYVEKFGRPHSIQVRTEHTECYIDDLCRKLDIKLIKDKGLPVMDMILEDIMNFMG